MKYIIAVSYLFIFMVGFSQDPGRFINEVESLQKKYDTLWDASKKTIVFTGSSSIRTWNNLNTLFHDHEILNTGFGGSQTTDLLAYTNELILRYNPYKVFIYEGDNDLAAQKRPKEIINTTVEIIKRIKDKNKETQIILISAKPSIVRWSLKRKYKNLNRKLKKLCKKDDLLQFADVWKPMLDKRKLNRAIFEEDGLHMNSKGYEIWYTVIKPFIN
ncbi:MAG: G-D-S-L family lipolytic protein [Maribacter sp.]|nr:G-D-S-L family lipolytic protein [Maribacter sp.]